MACMLVTPWHPYPTWPIFQLPHILQFGIGSIVGGIGDAIGSVIGAVTGIGSGKDVEPPKPPEPVPAPKPPPEREDVVRKPPAVPVAAVDDTAGQMAQDRAAELRRRGRASMILTSPGGVTSDAPLGRPAAKLGG